MTTFSDADFRGVLRVKIYKIYKSLQNKDYDTQLVPLVWDMFSSPLLFIWVENVYRFGFINSE